MALSINHLTRVIYVPQADLTPLGGALYLLDVNDFRLWLKDWEDDAVGIQMPNTHNHYPEVILGGVTLARVVEIINGYTVTFEDGQYAVVLGGANNNLADVTNVNQVSIRSNNSAGLTAAANPEDMAAAVFAQYVEGTLDLKEVMRLVSAVLMGKVTGAGSGTVTFRDTGDSKDRVVATVDLQGNRSAVVLDPTD